MIAKGCAAEMSLVLHHEVYHLNKSERCTKQNEVVFIIAGEKIRQ